MEKQSDRKKRAGRARKKRVMNVAEAAAGAWELPEIIFPKIPGDEEREIYVSPEFIAVKGGTAYFSLDTEAKEILIEQLLMKYRKSGIRDSGFGKKLYIRYEEGEEEPFVKKKAEIVEALLTVVYKTGKFSISLYDVLAYQKVGKGCFLLTAEGLYSPAFLEEHGRYIALRELGKTDERGIFGQDGNCIYRGRLSDSFLGMSAELIALNGKVKSLPMLHPFCRESEENRERYLTFLVYRLFANMGITADGVIRIGLLAGQFRIPAVRLSDIIRQVWEVRKQKGISYEKYAQSAYSCLTNDFLAYKYLLYYDIVAFELYRSGSYIKRSVTWFGIEAEKRFGMVPIVWKRYINCLEAAEKNGVDLAEITGLSDEKERAMYRMAAYEAEVRKELTGGR